MSNFYEQKDDSNLQYDDAAFLYFLASALSLSAIVLTISVLKDLWKMKLKNTGELDKVKKDLEGDDSDNSDDEEKEEEQEEGKKEEEEKKEPLK